MDNLEFTKRCTEIFRRILDAADQLDPDVLEADAGNDMLTLTVPRTGEKIIVNTQRAVQQVWVAGRGRGIHFRFRAERGSWEDDKELGIELYRFVADCVEEASGSTLPVNVSDSAPPR